MIPFVDETSGLVAVVVVLALLYFAWRAGRRSGRREVFNPKRTIRRVGE